MILKYNEFINNRSKERNQIDEIFQDDDLSVYHWDVNNIDPRVFDSIFKIEEISDSTLKRMTGNSYPEECEVSIHDLRYLVIPHYDGKGYIRIGELVCHKDVADEFMYYNCSINL